MESIYGMPELRLATVTLTQSRIKLQKLSRTTHL